jgi:hypothetical protein
MFAVVIFQRFAGNMRLQSIHRKRKGRQSMFHGASFQVMRQHARLPNRRQIKNAHRSVRFLSGLPSAQDQATLKNGIKEGGIVYFS